MPAHRQKVTGLSLDYASLVSSVNSADSALLGAALLTAFGERYEAEQHGCALVEFEQAGAHYLFDLASSADLPQEDRTVGAWALTPPIARRRDKSYQRGFPMARTPGDPVDRGHLIPHLSGGQYGPNIYRQDRRLNQGLSEEGRRYRALEREAAATPGSFYVGHLLYVDDSAYPSHIEIGLLRDGVLRAERFDNQPRSN